MARNELERLGTPAPLGERDRDAHKGDFGRLLIVGGSRGMIGAVALAADAAFRGGAGLVTFAAPETVQLSVATLCPCATSTPLSCEPDGRLAGGAVRQMGERAEKADVLAVGPGMDIGTVQQNLVRAALECGRPVVLDADGLNNLARIDDWPAMRTAALILTPHPGEFARLTGEGIGDIQGDRVHAASNAASRWAGDVDAPLIVVLKGAGTVVTDGRRVYVNDTGNPGMACGGSGDVLTGLTAALLGAGLEPMHAACLAVRVHGLAGDAAADRLGETSVMASDLVDFLPEALGATTG